MRSILALGLAALILAAHAPGFFLETPVCSAVDGVRVIPGRAAVPVPVHETPSCCGKPDCPMHPHGCGKVVACSMGAAATHGPASHGPKLCAPSCGTEGARVAPGIPDPGTLETAGRTAPCLAETGRVNRMSRIAPTHDTDPAVPPPRA